MSPTLLGKVMCVLLGVPCPFNPLCSFMSNITLAVPLLILDQSKPFSNRTCSATGTHRCQPAQHDKYAPHTRFPQKKWHTSSSSQRSLKRHHPPIWTCDIIDESRYSSSHEDFKFNCFSLKSPRKGPISTSSHVSTNSLRTKTQRRQTHHECMEACSAPSAFNQRFPK